MVTKTEIKSQIPLAKNSASFDLHIPEYVETKIRHLCSKIHDVEWSGVLFYKTEGEFAEEGFNITCVDILPMDIGNSTFTNFNDTPDIINYRIEHPELSNEHIYEGLIHSHNNMAKK